eukprot:TRINITY_DN3529_c0_g1_i1.p1 TRINITY_DN3529_c0_g1~~TRINITY_DN3529_c0_g1_i1.p1  ORF type:complete len:337 (+),score=57.25 TRINITY_DN3529_c0_g1_i1:30-1040(+)
MSTSSLEELHDDEEESVETEHDEESSTETSEEYSLAFRYRNIVRRITFYEPPKGFCEEHPSWNEMIKATKMALRTAFGEVTSHMVGVSLHLQGPVVPVSILVKRPQKYAKEGYLDLILNDDSAFLADLHSTRKPIHTVEDPMNRNLSILNHFSTIDEFLESIGLEDLLGTFNHHDVDLKLLLELNESDFKEMNISLGTRKKIIKKIQEMRTTGNTNYSMKTWKWQESQSRLSLPTDVPFRPQPISFSRLQNIKYHQDFAQIFSMHLRYFGYAIIKLSDQMSDDLQQHKQMWMDFFDKDQDEKDECTLSAFIKEGYGGYYDENDREMFQVCMILVDQ